MRITIELDDAAEAARALAFLGGGDVAQADSKPAPAKRGATKKAEEPKAEEPKPPKATDEDARNALKDHAKAHSRESAIAILESFGAKAVSALDASKYPDLIARLKEGPADKPEAATDF